MPLGEPSPLAQLSNARIELCDTVADLDRAIADCRESRQDLIDLIGEVDRAIRAELLGRPTRRLGP
jgi:hypothetical protein